MSSIKCGNCTSVHSSVAEVRACYGVTPATVVTGRDLDRVTARQLAPVPVLSGRKGSQAAQVAAAAARSPQPVAPVAPATEKQVTFILTLAGERNVALTREQVEALSKREASDTITGLLAMPKPQPTVVVQGQAGTVEVPDEATVPAGRYALRTEGVVKFYKVDRPTEGRWAGKVFVKVQASDDLHPVRGSAGVAVLARIAEDAQGAMALYGHEIGSCGKCGRTLTDEDSRARGIGPVCIQKMGW